MTSDALKAEINRVVGECAGAVSMCWEPRPLGVFDSAQAAVYLEGAVARLINVLEAEEKRVRADERRAVTDILSDQAQDAVDEVRERLREAWREEGHAVMFNHAGDDLTPAQRVGKWLGGESND